ncbi:hypothetical protein H8A97_11975 [Bradyrhizobium sp. Arg62]|uniref:hypothetical protein n=1 Tax=Bradyrhizobium brasilense TaxID=1419277 RepID=UPI001E536A22|nr:hypothetical protein [Bradyrhizobium brasilense]MCC8945793.1 hypothetical protein [Bradyrhizobium brasilense]
MKVPTSDESLLLTAFAHRQLLLHWPLGSISVIRMPKISTISMKNDEQTDATALAAKLSDVYRRERGKAAIITSR